MPPGPKFGCFNESSKGTRWARGPLGRLRGSIVFEHSALEAGYRSLDVTMEPLPSSVHIPPSEKMARSWQPIRGACAVGLFAPAQLSVDYAVEYSPSIQAAYIAPYKTVVVNTEHSLEIPCMNTEDTAVFNLLEWLVCISGRGGADIGLRRATSSTRLSRPISLSPY